MNNPTTTVRRTNYTRMQAVLAILVFACLWTLVAGKSARGDSHQEQQAGSDGAPYPNMPRLTPIGVRIGKHLEVPESAKGPAIEPSKGFRVQGLGNGLYMITDNVYQSLFLVYETGVVVVDAPPNYARYILEAIVAVTDQRLTHIVYSHSHIDHIGGARALGGQPIIIAQEETARLLSKAKDPNRPTPTITFRDKYTLRVGSQVLELSYHGNAHAPGNIFIEAPAQKTLMVVDIIYPGWMPWREFGLARDVPGYFSQVEEINRMNWETLVSGHVQRTGTHADVQLQLEFMNDLKRVTREAMKSVQPGEELDPTDNANPWAAYRGYIDRVVIRCVNLLTPKWSVKLAAFDVFIWDQCYAMEESLRTDEQ